MGNPKAEALRWAAETLLASAGDIDKRIYASDARQQISHEDGVEGEGQIEVLREHAARFVAEADRLEAVGFAEVKDA